jgi:HAD superfamily hydrolase (TIGR01509 family)
VKTLLVDAVNTTIIKNEAGEFVKFQELFDLLETYPNRKIIVTNANDGQLKEFGLGDVPYPVFTMKHNPDKPDPLFFKTLLAQYNLQASDIVYFEHNPQAVESARSVGICAYHYDKDLKDLASLKIFLNENLGNN